MSHPIFDPSFTPDQLKSAVIAHYGPNIDRAFWLARETLVKNLCVVHSHRSRGNELSVPDEVVVKAIAVPLV